MSQVNASVPIEQTTASYLAGLRGAQPSAKTATQTESGFTAALEAVESEPLPPPTRIVKQSAPRDVATTSETQEQLAIGSDMESEGALGFDDLVDLLNPLHHIPVVGTIYRQLTGDTIQPDVQVVGAIGFGLATGSVLLSAASGIASAIFEQQNGEEPTVQIVNALFGDEETVQLADASAEVEEADTQAFAVADASENEGAAEIALAAQEVAAPAVPALPRVASAYQDGVHPLMSAGDSGGMRIGNVLYAGPQVRSAAKVTSLPASAATENSLGALIHEQAKAQASGQSLPPELVQDMMLKAYAKYSSASQIDGVEAIP